MSTTDTPLTDILAQVQARAEAWAREASAARDVLAGDIARAREELSGETVATATQEAQAAVSMAQRALDEARAEATSLREELSTASREAGDLRRALEAAELELASLRAQAADTAPAQELTELRAALADAQEELGALRDRPAPAPTMDAFAAREIAELRSALGEAEMELAALKVARAHGGEAHAHRAEVETLEAALIAKDEELTATREALDELRGALGRAEAARAMAEKEIAAFDAHGHKLRMGTILVEAGILTPSQLESALAEQAVNPQRRVGAIVVERGYTTEEVVARILAAQLRLPFVTLAPGSFDATAPRLISGHLARLHKAIPIQQDGELLTVAMANPLDLIAIEDMEIASRCRVEPVVATRSAIDAVLAGLG